jgi:hypothetical protein
MRRGLALWTVAAAIGCKEITPAPQEQEALMQFMFTEFEDASDETMAEAFRNFDEAVDGANLEYTEGIVANLSQEDTDRTGYTHANPANGVGLFIINPVACTLDQMVDLVTMKDQVGTYGTYEEFSRTWGADVSAFQEEESLTASWEDDFRYINGLLGIDYVANTEGTGRWIPQIDDETTPWGRMLLTRRVMTAPATMDKEDHSYPQDWRVEAYYERSSGQLVHMAAMWREAVFGSLSHDSELTQRTLLNGLKDWDTASDEACAGR